MIHAAKDPITEPGASVFLNVNEAHELVKDLQDAIVQAETKNGNHKDRGINC